MEQGKYLIGFRWLLNEGYKIEKIANFLKLPLARNKFFSKICLRIICNHKNRRTKSTFSEIPTIAKKYSAKNVQPLIMKFCIQ